MSTSDQLKLPHLIRNPRLTNPTRGRLITRQQLASSPFSLARNSAKQSLHSQRKALTPEITQEPQPVHSTPRHLTQTVTTITDRNDIDGKLFQDHDLGNRKSANRATKRKRSQLVVGRLARQYNWLRPRLPPRKRDKAPQLPSNGSLKGTEGGF